MQAEIKKLPKSLVELTVTVSYADYQKAEKQALEQISKEMKVDGFRSGHIPEAVVREKAGPELIESVTLENALPISYAAAVKEHDLRVIAQPKIEVKQHVKKPGDELIYVATVSVMPEVKLGNYKKIKVKKQAVKVTAKEIDETVDMIVSRFAEWKKAERPAKDGDRVEIDFEGFDEAGKSIPNTTSKTHPVILGSKSLIPGFEEAVVGMKLGEEKEFNIDFPKDYHAKDMQGKKVKFRLKLNSVEERVDKQLTEALIERVTGQKQPVDEFKKRVEEDLKCEMEQRAQADVDSKVVQEIIKITSAELPESLIQDEVALLKEERMEAVKRQGLTWEQYLKHIKKTDADFATDYHKPAQERLLARLGVNEIIRAEKIEASETDVEKRIQEIVGMYPEDQKNKVLEYYKKDSEAYRALKNNLSADKLIDMFVEK